MAAAPPADAARPADAVDALHATLDALALAMFEASRGLPDAPRDPSRPDPAVAALAADVVAASRAVDAGADAIAAAAPGALEADLAAAREAHEAARLEVLASAGDLEGARDALTIVLDAAAKDLETLGRDAIGDANVGRHLAAADPRLPAPPAAARAASHTFGGASGAADAALDAASSDDEDLLAVDD